MYGEHSMPPLRRPRHAPGPPVGVRLLRRFWQHFFPPAVGEGEAGAGLRPFCADYGHCDRGGGAPSPACAAPEAEEAPCFSRAELEDMIRRWDLEQNEWACRDLLITAFPQATGRWSAEELAEMDTMDLLVETGRQDPDTALRMVELLLSTAEGHLQEPEAAYQLLGWDMSDLLVSEVGKAPQRLPDQVIAVVRDEKVYRYFDPVVTQLARGDRLIVVRPSKERPWAPRPGTNDEETALGGHDPARRPPGERPMA